MTDKTLEPDQHTFSELHRLSGSSKKRPRPKVIVLYHPDLSRIGAAIPPTAFEDGQWVEVGRLAPDFVAPTPEITGGALGDPYISRRQFSIRWVEGWGRFELRQEGRRPLATLELSPERPDAVFHQIEGEGRAEPGTLLSIGNRVLLGLSLDIWNGPDEERLGMVGETEGVWRLRNAITQVARFRKPALILGPTGAGKELVARALHMLSEHTNGPFVPINCAALPEHLAESLLFGHKKGAFTGASANRDGAFVESSGGCLFMDEIGELPLPTQAKLLRVLQEGSVTPVGSNRTVPVNVRLVAATHRDLKGAMEDGHLRADFYYRITAHQIHLPSLQERQWDVPMLFVHFLRQSRDSHPELAWLWEGLKTSKPTIPMSFFIGLMRHPWPGNIRELQNTVEQVSRYNLDGAPFTTPPLFEEAPPSMQRAARSRTATLDPEPTVPSPPPAPITRSTVDSALGRSAQVKVANYLGIARKTLARLLPPTFEPQRSKEDLEDFASRVEDALLDALLALFEEHAFNQVHIAEHMSISRTTLVRLMKRFGIPRARDLGDGVLDALQAETGGDMEAMAQRLGISTKALALYLRHVGTS